MHKTSKLILFLYLILLSCNNAKKPIFKFATNNILVGTILVGEKKNVFVEIKNTGNDTLIIQGFECSCECTTPIIKGNTKIGPSDSISLQLVLTGYENNRGKKKSTLCTFKSNTDSVFSRLNISYFTK